MEKILNAAKCIECGHVLQSPIILPCGISICLAHIGDHLTEHSTEEYPCVSCGLAHSIPAGGFTPNHTCELLIDSYFGERHHRAFAACQTLANTIDTFDAMQTNLDALLIGKSIGELREKVRTKAHQLKCDIDERAQMLNAELAKYENECKANLAYLMKNSSSVVRVMSFEKLRTMVNEWMGELDRVDLVGGGGDDEGGGVNGGGQQQRAKWDGILERCEAETSKLSARVSEMKSVVLLYRYEQFKAKQAQFCRLVLSENGGPTDWYIYI